MLAWNVIGGGEGRNRTFGDASVMLFAIPSQSKANNEATNMSNM